jgi:outer membrane protein TolC
MSDRPNPRATYNSGLRGTYASIKRRLYSGFRNGSGSGATLLALVVSGAAGIARAQMPIGSAVALAENNNPRVKIAQADVARTSAALSETKDVYIPSLTAGAGLGEAYGYSPNPPTLFTFNSGSLIFNPAQRYYIRSARAALEAAQHSYDEARQAVAEDTAQAFLSVQHDEQRLAALTQQTAYASRLVAILQQRLDAGEAAPIDLTQGRLTAANIRVALLHTQDDLATDRAHLARLLGVSPAGLDISDALPATPTLDPNQIPERNALTPAVASAYSGALAREEQAKGDASYRFKPQLNLVLQYNRYATFTNSFNTLQGLTGQKITPNEYVVGVQITLPLYDRYREAKARETAADASHSLHEADQAKLQSLDAQARLLHSIPEIEARANVAELQQQLAEQQLAILRVQLQSGNPNGQQMTPADEQTSLISERDKYLGAVDASYQLHQTEITLLRLTGRLMGWLQSPSAPAALGPGEGSPAEGTPALPVAPSPQ